MTSNRSTISPFETPTGLAARPNNSFLTQAPTSNIQSVAILGSNDGYSFEFGCACELFVRQQKVYSPWYSSEVLLAQTYHLSSTRRLADFDMLVIPDDSWLAMPNYQLLINQIKQLYHADGRLVAFGSGVYVLAAAGLLNGKTVPGDNERQAKQSLYGEVTFCRKTHFSVEPGIFCSGFGFTALELGLYLIGLDRGRQYIEDLAKTLRLAPDAVSLVLDRLNINEHPGSSRIEQVLEWADSNLELIENVDQLADRACLSRRSFDRQFRATMKVSPKDWLTQKRLMRAKEYLATSDLSIEQIAVLTGFGSGNNFRNNFQKQTGYSPRAYRKEAVLV